MIKLINSKNISVVGDSIIDEYFYVNAEKVSPEFPIPILQAEEYKPKYVLPGGAANVCYQFLHFNKSINYFSILDTQAYNLINNYNFIDMQGCVVTEKAQVSRKKRFYQGVFPLCRIDIEKKNLGISENLLFDLQKNINENLKNKKSDICIFSDYNKGVFTEKSIISSYYEAVGEKCIKIVDPKGSADKWYGCDIFKPNYSEACFLTSTDNVNKQIDKLLLLTNAKAIIITKSGEGVYGKVNNEYFEYNPQLNIKVSSVVGAGDCFIAYLAAGLAGELSVIKAVEFAYKAASEYVQNQHNKPVDCFNLIKDFSKKIVFTSGVFDLLHLGHLETLSKSKCLGDKLIVGINSDNSTKRLKGNNRPINNQETRKKMLESLRFVDEVFIFDEDTPYELMKKIKPDIIVKGSDYTKESVVGNDLAEVVIIKNLPEFSTSSIISKINN